MSDKPSSFVVDMPLKDFPDITVPVDVKDILLTKLVQLEFDHYAYSSSKVYPKSSGKPPLPNAHEKWSQIADDISEIYQLVKKYIK